MDPKDRNRAGYSQRTLTDPGALSQVRARHAEIRAADAAVLLTEAVQGLTARAHVTEPRTYRPDGQHSWFADLYKAERGRDAEARARLDAHEREAAAEEPRRAEARARAAQAAYEAMFAATPAEQRALSAFTGAGGAVFERRAASRIDGQGGYFVPPSWLIDQYVPQARADAPLAEACTTLPLPAMCDSVNVPRMLTGTGTGAQQGDLAPVVSRDVSDSLVNARVVTIAGQQDVTSAWLDQGIGGAGGNLDAMIWADLQRDEALQLDGQLILGGGYPQATGLFPPQTLPGTSLAVYAPNGNTTTGQQWYYGSGTGPTLAATVAQCISGVSRARGKHPTHLLTNPWVWDFVASMTDQQSRPYLPPKGPHPVPDGAELPPGIVGYLHGLPVIGDLNVPTTQGGGVSPPQQPYLASVTGAQYAGAPGLGASALYTPVVPCLPADFYVFTSEPHMRLMQEVLAGALQYRFQVYTYVAVMMNRYQALSAGTLPNSGGWVSGACSSYGVVTQQGANSLLSITANGF